MRAHMVAHTHFGITVELCELELRIFEMVLLTLNICIESTWTVSCELWATSNGINEMPKFKMRNYKISM